MPTPKRLSDVLVRLEPLICDDAAAAETARVQAEALAVQRRLERQQRLERERVPLKAPIERAIIAGARLEPRPSLLAVQRWLADRDAHPILVLSGGTGAGKSVAAAWALANGPSYCRWRSGAQALRAFAANFGPGAEDQDAMRACRLLVLDEVGVHLDAARTLAMLLDLFDSRKGSAARTRTVVTTNMLQSAFLQRFADQRLHSRMREDCRWVVTTAPDSRGVRS